MFVNEVLNGQASPCQTASFPAGAGFPQGIAVAFHCVRYGKKDCILSYT